MTALHEISPEALERYSFAAGSMGPKVEAACAFARATGNVAIITGLGAAADLANGETGARVATQYSNSLGGLA